MRYADSSTHRLTEIANQHERLCDVMIGDTFHTVPSVESGRTTSSTFADVVTVEDVPIRVPGQPTAMFVEIVAANGDTFTASAWTPVDIEK